MKKFTFLTLVAVFALALVGCETTKETNSNKAVVVNSSNANANTNVANTTNANTTASANRDDDWDADLTEDEVTKDRGRYETRAKGMGDTVGQGAKDLWLWTKARAALAGVDDLRDSTINVDVNNGVVTLRGTVGSAEQKSAAEKAAKVEGASSVKNSLTVSKDDSMTNQATSGGNTKSNANTK